MNQGSTSYGPIHYGDPHQSMQSQPPAPQSASSGGLSSFSQPPLQPQYQQPNYQYPPFNHGGVSSAGGQPGVPGPMSVHPGQQLLPLPQNSGMGPVHSPLGPPPGGPPTPGGAPGQQYGNHPFDTTGQIAPPGMKPRVAATLWEDEGSLCFQVEARGVCVARREDNHMINGTKLLNVAGMTRGRRDGILKSEKVRHVVKIGPMHLKGVWIPFERALDFANKEKITEMLYPLFVHNIGAFLYHPTNTSRTNAVMAAVADLRRDSNVLSLDPALDAGSALVERAPDLMTSPQPPMHTGMHNPLRTPLPHNHGQPRPGIERSMSFPTPPSSASSVMGVSSDGGFWNNGMVAGQNNQSLAIDTVVNSRSLPTTPATTPPGGLQQMQQYPPQNPMYQSGNMSQQGIQRYGQGLPQPSQYMNQHRDMGPPPPSRAPEQSMSRPASRQQDHVKDETEQNGLVTEHDGQHGQDVHGGDDQSHPHDNVHENEYPAQDSGYSNGAHRYYPPLNTEHNQHMSPDMIGSPNHGQAPATPARSSYGSNVPRTVDNPSGATPRTASTPQWSQSNEYSTPPSNGTQPQDGRYQLATGDPASSGAPSQDNYPPNGLGVSMPGQTVSHSYNMSNGSSASNKRSRDDEEEHTSRPSSRGGQDGRNSEPEVGGLKRRKTTGSAPATGIGSAAESFDRNTRTTRATINPSPRVGARR